MEFTTNWLAIIVAMVVGMGIAGAWYGKAFGNAWMKLTGVTKEHSRRAGKAPIVLLLGTNSIFAVTLAGSIALVSEFYGNTSLWLALVVGFALWLGVSAATLVQHNAFELKPAKLTLINSGYQLILFLGMALVIGLFGS